MSSHSGRFPPSNRQRKPRSQLSSVYTSPRQLLVGHNNQEGNEVEGKEPAHWGSMREVEGSETSCQGSEREFLRSSKEAASSKHHFQRHVSMDATSDLRQKLEEVEDMLRQAVDDRNHLEERATWAMMQLEDRTTEVHTVRKELEKVRAGAEKAEQRLESTRLHFHSRLAELEDELTAKDDDNATARRCLDFERQRSDAQTVALTQELKAVYCQLDERVESTKVHFQSQIDDLSDVLSSRDSEIDFLSKELDKADICIESNRRHFQKQTEIYANALKAKCTEADSLRQHLKDADSRLSKAGEQVQARDALIQSLRNQLNEARRDSQVKGRLVAKLSIADLRQQSPLPASPVMHSIDEAEDDAMDPNLLFVKGALKCFNEKLVDTAFMCVQFLQDVQLKIPSASQEDRDSADRVLGSRLVQIIVQRKVLRRRGMSDTHPRLAQLVLQLFFAHWTYAVMKGSYSISRLQDDDRYAGNAFHECILDVLHDLASVLWVFGWRISGFDELVASLDAANLSERLPTLPVYQAIHSLVHDAYDLRTSMSDIPAFLRADFVTPPCDTPFDSMHMEDADSDFHTLRLVSGSSVSSRTGNGGYLMGTVGIGLEWDSSDGITARGSAKKVETLSKPRVLLEYTVESLLK